MNGKKIIIQTKEKVLQNEIQLLLLQAQNFSGCGAVG